MPTARHLANDESHGAPRWEGDMSGPPVWAELPVGTLILMWICSCEAAKKKEKKTGVRGCPLGGRKWTQRSEDLKCTGESSSSFQQFQCAILPSRNKHRVMHGTGCYETPPKKG